jgi:hypothetical protein
MLCENFFLHLHSHPIDLVVLTVDKDTNIDWNEISPYGSGSLESECQLVGTEAIDEVTETTIRSSDARSGLEEANSTVSLGYPDVPDGNPDLAHAATEHFSGQDHSLMVDERRDPCEEIYEDLARLYLTVEYPESAMTILDGMAPSPINHDRHRSQRRKLPNVELSTIFPTEASPSVESELHDSIIMYDNCKVFSTQLATDNLTAATRDAQPLDPHDYLRPVLYRKKNKNQKGSSRRISL